ncbi:hypothetical protein KC329_g61 [Hortaea werneckii]|nr:hypothetical protein KC329_g61 [Hortaea werneckii]
MEAGTAVIGLLKNMNRSLHATLLLTTHQSVPTITTSLGSKCRIDRRAENCVSITKKLDSPSKAEGRSESNRGCGLDIESFRLP